MNYHYYSKFRHPYQPCNNNCYHCHHYCYRSSTTRHLIGSLEIHSFQLLGLFAFCNLKESKCNCLNTTHLSCKRRTVPRLPSFIRARASSHVVITSGVEAESVCEAVVCSTAARTVGAGRVAWAGVAVHRSIRIVTCLCRSE